MLIIHGQDDPTVPVELATRLVEAVGDRGRVSIVPGGNHTFNTPNPLPPEASMSPQLRALISAVIEFARTAVAADRSEHGR